MDWTGWAVFGTTATAILTAALIGAQMLGWTRLDLPLLLGTLLREDPDHARVVGFGIHLVIGQFFAFFYMWGFAALGTATWWLGGLFGAVHAAIALTALVPMLSGVNPRIASVRAGLETRTVLEPPGLLALNYGRQTPAVTFGAHLLYGVAPGCC